MARPCQIDKQLVIAAQRLVRRTRDADELRAAQAVLLPARGMTLEQTASFLGVSRATVPRLQARLRRWQRTGRALYHGWGGRRRMHLSRAEEKAFLKPWRQQARSGGLVVVAPVRAALAQQLGRPVVATVVYRLLARNGWRKLAPDTRHPKSSPARRAAWKKNSRRHWQPY